MSDIFISHSHADRDFVELLQNKLTGAGFTVWRDTGLVPGTNWREEIDRAIQEASTVVVTVTPQAMASAYVNYEWAFAWGAGMKIIPILLEKTALHPRLESLQFLDFTSHIARPWDALIDLLRKQKERQVDGIRPVGQIHGYSGEWQIRTTFSEWQDQPVVGNDRVVFEGTMFLLLSADGQRGSGTQTGQLHTSIGTWKATYQVANQVTNAYITQDGCLHIHLQVLMRRRIAGDPPPPPYRDELFGTGRFEVILSPARDSSRLLAGGHHYPSGYIQEAAESYKYLGLFGATP